MKEVKTILSILFLIVVLSGCNSEASNSGGEASNSNGGNNSENITLVTSVQGGTWFATGGALGDVITQNTDHNMTVIPSGGSVENADLFKNKEVEMGYMTADFAYSAYNGNEPFKGEAMDHLRGFVMYDPIFFNFIVREDSDIEKFSDIKGKKFGTGPAGSLSYDILGDVLEVHGMSYDDVDEQPLSIAEQVEALKDGNLDMFGYLTGGPSAPASALLDLASTHDIKFIELDEEKEEELVTNYPYQRSTIPEGLYPGLGEVDTLAVGVVIMASADLSEDTVYDLTKTFWENKETLESSHEAWNGASLEGFPVPLHPGAEKYYEEEGMEATFLE